MKHVAVLSLCLSLWMFRCVCPLSAQTDADYRVERAEVKPYKGRPALYINDVPVVPQFYALTDRPTGNRSYEAGPSHNIALFADVGFTLYQLDLWFEEMITEDGSLDIGEAVRQVRGVLAHCPKAAVMFRLHCNPTFRWLRQHPEECTRFADAGLAEEPYRPAYQNYLWKDLDTVARCSYASQRWLTEMGAMVRQFCRDFADTPEGRHVMGLQLTMGVNGENHYWAFVRHDPDVSEPMQRCFRAYLTEKYHNDKALRKAWNNPDVTLATASVPGMERHQTSAGIFRDPQREQAIIDYYDCQHQAVTNSINYFAKIVKESWPRPVVVGCFYGYYLSMFGRQAAGGHLREEDVLNSPYVDFLSAPQAYNKNSRLPGGPGVSRGLVESVNLHGKLWLDEMDQPSHYGFIMLGGLQRYPKAESIQILRKFVLHPFLRGGGMWYYDFGPIMTTGWWDDPDYMTEFARMKQVEERYFHHNQDNPADVLMVYDTKVFYHTASRDTDDPITDQTSVDVVTIEAFKSGASVATCYLSDLKQMPLATFKVVVFVNCFHIEPELRQWIRREVARDGRTLVWLTAPGFNDGRTLDVRHVRECAGMEVDAFYADSIPDMRFVAAWDTLFQPGERIAEVGKTIFMSEKRGGMSWRQVFFRVKDEVAVPLAYYSDGSMAAARKRHDGFTDYFVGLPMVDCRLWQHLFRDAGCHIYDEDSDAVVAGSGLVMIHTKDGGKRTIRLRNGKVVTLFLNPLQTLLLDVETGEVVL